jgi:hypothetical protein
MRPVETGTPIRAAPSGHALAYRAGYGKEKSLRIVLRSRGVGRSRETGH